MTKEKKTRLPGIYVLDDGRYRVRATVACSRTGKMIERQATLQHGAQEWEALRELESLKAELRGSVEATPKAKRMTVRDYAERWLEVRSERLKPSTAARYADELARHILPRLGDIYLDALTRSDLEAWVTWAEGAKARGGGLYSSATLLAWWRTLTALLKDAAAERGLSDPTRRVASPRRRAGGRHRERRTLTAQELARVLAAAHEVAPARYTEICAMAYTGMRLGELYALRWDRVDIAARSITVDQAVWHGQVGAPKTHDPRIVPIPAALAAVLTAHRQQMLAQQHPGLASGLVFPSAQGTHRCSTGAQKTLASVSEAVGLDFVVSPQVLRRTYNTLMLRGGADRIVLRSMMGHTSEEMTERYAGVDLADKLAVVDGVFR